METLKMFCQENRQRLKIDFQAQKVNFQSQKKCRPRLEKKRKAAVASFTQPLRLL